MTRILAKLFNWWNTGEPKEVDIIKPKVQTLFTYESENPKKSILSRPNAPGYVSDTVQTESSVQTLSNISTSTEPIQFDLEKFDSEKVDSQSQEQIRDNPFDIRFYNPPNMKMDKPKVKYGFQEISKPPLNEQNIPQTTSRVSLGGLKFIFGKKNDPASQKSDDEPSKSTSDDDDRIEEDDKGHISDNSFYFYSDDKMENDFSFGGHYMVDDTPKYHQNQIQIIQPESRPTPIKQDNESSYTYETGSETETQEHNNASTSADESDTSHHHIETNYNQLSSSDELLEQPQQQKYQPVYTITAPINLVSSDEYYEEEDNNYSSSEQDNLSTAFSTAADSTSSESTESESSEEDTNEEEEAESDAPVVKRHVVTKTIPPKNAGMKIPRQSMYNPIPPKQSESEENSTGSSYAEEEEEDENEDESNKDKTSTEEEKNNDDNEDEDEDEDEDEIKDEEDKHASSSSQMVSDDNLFLVQNESIDDKNQEVNNSEEPNSENYNQNSEHNDRNSESNDQLDEGSENDDKAGRNVEEEDTGIKDEPDNIHNGEEEDLHQHHDDDRSPPEEEEAEENASDVQNLISYNSLIESAENNETEKVEDVHEPETKSKSEQEPEVESEQKQDKEPNHSHDQILTTEQEPEPKQEALPEPKREEKEEEDEKEKEEEEKTKIDIRINRFEVPTKARPLSTVQLRPPDNEDPAGDYVSQSFGQDDGHFGDEDMDNINYEVSHEYSDFHEL